MSKKVCVSVILVISIYLMGCNPVANNDSDIEELDTLASKEESNGLTVLIDTVRYDLAVQKYADSVEKILGGLIATKTDVFGSSAEGGEINVYRQGVDTLKLTAVFYGETGKNQYELYLRDKKLVLFSEKAVSYRAPIDKNPVRIDKEILRSFVLYNGGIVLGKEGKMIIPRNEYVVKSEDIKDIYSEIKLQLQE